MALGLVSGEAQDGSLISRLILREFSSGGGIPSWGLGSGFRGQSSKPVKKTSKMHASKKKWINSEKYRCVQEDCLEEFSRCNDCHAVIDKERECDTITKRVVKFIFYKVKNYHSEKKVLETLKIYISPTIHHCIPSTLCEKVLHCSTSVTKCEKYGLCNLLNCKATDYCDKYGGKINFWSLRKESLIFFNSICCFSDS